MMSELRKDYIQDKYVIIAPKRARRPHQIGWGEKTPCAFCPEKVNKVQAILTVGSEKNWLIKVIKNIYPAVSLNNPKAYGLQEIVIETPNHFRELEDLPERHIRKLLEVYAQRTYEISKNKRIAYILIFKNSGAAAGASISHSHSQIFATDFIPPHVFDKSQKCHEYMLRHGSCVYCDIIKKESRSSRLIYKDKHIIAFCPYASMHNYEVWIMPIRHVDNISNLTKEEIKSFAKILKISLKKVRKLGLPYNYYFHQVINDEDQHLYMKVIPRGSVWAGVEIGSGIIINPISPEKAAKFYRGEK